MTDAARISACFAGQTALAPSGWPQLVHPVPVPARCKAEPRAHTPPFRSQCTAAATYTPSSSMFSSGPSVMSSHYSRSCGFDAAAGADDASSRSVDTTPPVIFLDVDGVLHSLFGEDVFKETCCALLARLVRSTGALIVLSSTWRLEEENMTALNEMFLSRGLAPIREMTKDFGRHREEEICDWLDRHPWCRRWIAIDDLDLTIRPNEHARRLRGHFVRTNSNVGMTPDDAVLAKSLLTGTGSTNEPSGFQATWCPNAAAASMQVSQRLGVESSEVAAAAVPMIRSRNGAQVIEPLQGSPPARQQVYVTRRCEPQTVHAAQRIERSSPLVAQ